MLIGAGACLLGNITIGTGTQIGAGSLVVTDLPERCVWGRFALASVLRITVFKRHRRAGSAPRDRLREKGFAGYIRCIRARIILAMSKRTHCVFCC